MGFKEAIRTCLFSKYATFQGRASRSEYWYFFLFMILAMFTLIIGGLAAGGFDAANADGFNLVRAYGFDFSRWGVGIWAFWCLFVLFSLYTFIPALAVGVRRLHDRDLSGWWYLGLWPLSYVPYVGYAVSIGWLVLNCLRGTDGPNRFGSDPLRPNHTADIFA